MCRCSLYFCTLGRGSMWPATITVHNMVGSTDQCVEHNVTPDIEVSLVGHKCTKQNFQMKCLSIRRLRASTNAILRRRYSIYSSMFPGIDGVWKSSKGMKSSIGDLSPASAEVRLTAEVANKRIPIYDKGVLICRRNQLERRKFGHFESGASEYDSGNRCSPIGF